MLPSWVLNPLLGGWQGAARPGTWDRGSKPEGLLGFGAAAGAEQCGGTLGEQIMSNPLLGFRKEASGLPLG